MTEVFKEDVKNSLKEIEGNTSKKRKGKRKKGRNQ